MTNNPALHPVVAIDGPAASGKSTVSRNLAKKMGYIYVDTGAMYRAIAWKSIRDGIDATDSANIVRWLPGVNLQAHVTANVSTLSVNGEAIEDAWLRTDEVNKRVSQIAAIPEVRTLAVERQRHLRSVGPLVAEGRDMGTVVFPDTPFKFYIDADPQVRAQRRQDQGQNDAILQRDKTDSSRATAPLKVADDAVVVDNSRQTPDQTVAFILEVIQSKSPAQQ